MEPERHDIRTFITKHKNKENEIYLEAQKQLELLRNRFKMAQKAVRKYLDWAYYNQGIESKETVEVVLPSLIWKSSEAKPVKVPEKSLRQIEDEMIQRIPVVQLKGENARSVEGKTGGFLSRAMEQLDEISVREINTECGRDGNDSEGIGGEVEKTGKNSLRKSKRGRKRKRQKGS